MTDTELLERDEAVATQLVAGRSVRAVRREFALTAAEFDEVIARVWPVDNSARLTMIRTDLGVLSKLTQVFLKNALVGCTQSGLVAIRVLEHKAELLGLNSASKIELQVISAAQEKPSHERLFEVVKRMVEQQPPAQRALRARLEELSAEQALELLGPPQPNDGNTSPPVGS